MFWRETTEVRRYAVKDFFNKAIRTGNYVIVHKPVFVLNHATFKKFFKFIETFLFCYRAVRVI